MKIEVIQLRRRGERGRFSPGGFFLPASILVAAMFCQPPSALAFNPMDYPVQGVEYNIAESLPGDQVNPDVSVSVGGGLIVWEDNVTDGSGTGISARRLDSSFSGFLSSFRVNQQGANDQNRPRVAMLKDGGAVIVWQGGPQGFQRIYARFLSASNTWVTGDVPVSTFANGSQVHPTVSVLTNGNVIVAWGSFNQEAANSLQGVYAQLLSPAGAKIGGEFRVNQTTAFNQRLPALAALADGRFVVAWVSEQQRFENSVDVFARIYSANGSPVAGEFMINTATNITGHPSVAASADGGFLMAWSELDLRNRSNNWDIIVRPVSAAGVGGPIRKANTMTHGDQIGPRVSAVGTDHLVVWMSLGQDGSREGVYGQFLRGDGASAGAELRVNSTTVSQQMHPAVASDSQGRFLVAWTSFAGGAGGFDLNAQRFASIAESLNPPEPPFVSVLSSNAMNLTWPALAGLAVSNYVVFADGSATPTATIAGNSWYATGLAPASAHYFRIAYVLADGRQSPLSGATTNTTYGSYWYHDQIPQEWMTSAFGPAYWNWPLPSADNDGDGASVMQEFLAGTDPTNPNSVLKMRLQRTQQGLYLNWNTQPGLIYQVSSTTDMTTWTSVGGPRFAAGYLDSIYLGPAGRGFYRVVRLR